MKKSIVPFVFAAVLMSAVFVSCKKKDDAAPTTTTNTPTTTTTTGFTWQENGGAVMTADSAFWVTGAWGTGIRAFKGGMANYFEINWATQSNTSVGTKTLGNSGDVTFIKGFDTYTNTTPQTINITAFSGNKLSGNFNIAISGGGSITAVSGTFGNIIYRP